MKQFLKNLCRLIVIGSAVSLISCEVNDIIDEHRKLGD